MAEPCHITRMINTYAKLCIFAEQLVEHITTRRNHLLAGNGARRLVFQWGGCQEDGPGGGKFSSPIKW